MNSHISALAQTLIIYLIMSVAYFGWGRVAIRVLGVSEQTSCSDITLIWLGWAFTLFIFQLLHFFFPLTAYVVVPIFIIGVVFSIPQIVNAFRRFPQKYSTLLRMVGILIIMLAVTCWIALRSMLPPTNYDSGLYHFNTIRWINSFPIVPGLGNLHLRFAFNQSFFIYVATLNFYPFFGYGRSIANSFLLLLTIATFVYFLRPVFKQPSILIQSHPFQYASVLFALPILGYLALSSNGLASPSPDLASNLLQLTMFVILAQDIAEWMKGKELNAHRAAVLIILATTAIIIKLSNLVFSVVIIGIFIAHAWQTLHFHIKGAIRIILIVVVVFLVWMLRGYVLSGAPFYPSTIGYVPLKWAVPLKNLVEEANWIYSWSRQPGPHWSKVIGSWDWFGPWCKRLSRDFEGVVYPLVLAMAFCIITMISRWLWHMKRAWHRCVDWVILLPIMVGLIYWFFTAPDPRFASALFWCLSLSMALLFLGSVQPLLRKRSFMAVMCVTFIIANLHFISYAVKHRYVIKAVSFSGWYPIKTVPLIQKTTLSGLVVIIPERGDQGWDSPLPLTPYFNPKLRLRIPGKLASGFTVTMP